MLTLEQKKSRKLGIGGSEIGILFGHSSFDESLGRKKSIVDLYFEKIDEEEILEEERPKSGRAYAGNKLESVIKEMFEEKKNVKVTTYKETFVHPEYSFLRGTLDGYIESENAIVDFKNVAPDQARFWGEEGTDILPIKYMLQVAMYCLILGKLWDKPIRKAYVSPLISGYDHRIYEYKHQDSIANAIISKASWFWNEHVIPRIPPPPITEEDAIRVYKDIDQGSIKIATEEELKIIEEIRALRNEGTKYSKQIKEMRAFIARIMKNHESLVSPTGEPLAKFGKGIKRLKNSLVKEMHPLIYEGCLVEGDKSLRIIGAKDE